MQILDIRTLSFIALISGVLLASGMHIVSRTLANERCVRRWAWGAISNSAGFFLLAMRGMVPDLLSIVAANTLFIVGLAWLYRGNRQFMERKPAWSWDWILSVFTAALLFYFTYFVPSLSARLTVLSAAAAALSLASALMLLASGRVDDRVVRRLVAAAFLSSALFMAVRSLMTAIAATPNADFMQARDPWQSLALVFGIGLNIILGIGLPLLVSVKIQRALRQQETDYRMLYNRTPAIMHSIDAQGKLIFVSDLWLDTFGYQRQDVIGRKSTHFLTEESRRIAVEKILPEFFITGSCVDVPYQFMTKDGRIVDVEISASLERDADGNILRSLAVMTDVTSRKRAESQFAESELRFRGAFEAAAHGMALVSTAGRFLKVNVALCKMLGYSAAQLLAMDFQAITHPDDLSADMHFLNDLLAGQIKSYQLEKRYFHRSGHIVWILLSVSLVRDGSGSPVHFVSQMQDTTQAKRALARAQTLLDTASDGIHVLDLDGNLVQFSQAFADLLGYTMAQTAHLTVAHWDVQAQADGPNAAWRARMQDAVPFETRYRRQDGLVIDVEVHAQAVMLEGVDYLYASARDVSARKQDQRQLEHLLAEQKAMLENDLIGIVKVRDRVIAWANPAFEKMLGYESGTLSGVATRQIFPDDETYLAFGAVAYPVILSGKSFRTIVEHRKKNGDPIWVEISGTILVDETAESLWYLLDITERRHLQQNIALSEQRMEFALAGADLGVWDLDLEQGKIDHNPRLSTMLGYASGELDVTPMILYAHLHPDDRAEFGVFLQAHLKDESQRFEIEYRVRHKQGHWVWIYSSGKVVERNASGRAVRMTGTNLDITDRKKADAIVHNMAFYDPLTELPNRRLVLDRLALALLASAQSHRHGALLFLDLDNFKGLNDTKGHEYGDLLLSEVARRLLACVRPEDTVARFGGDEFVVMVENLSTDLLHATEEAKSIAEKIRKALGDVYVLLTYQHHCTCSIGISLFAGGDVDVAQLLRQADTAMYSAKSIGRNAICVFHLEPGDVADDRADSPV